MKPPYCVGLTGGFGCGKSTVAELFSTLGAGIVDTDAISHALTAAGGAALPDLFAAFGDAYRQADGALDRRRMREKVFADAGARRALEAILHPRIRAQAARQIAMSNAPYVLLVVPLLIESGHYADLLDRILVVDCEPGQQLQRAMHRDGMSEAQARAVLAAQASRSARLALADDVIDNSGARGDLAEKVRQLHDRYLELAKKSC